jgi:predicted dehydrogenase
MAEAAGYTILGRGRWAARMTSILRGENRQAVEIPETRQAAGESTATYRSRLTERIRASGARIVWVCVLPGPHVAVMIDAALDAGLHVVVEKPWLASHQLTESLMARAKSLGRLLAVHYEYCCLSEVERWREDFYSQGGLGFHGRFFLDRPNHTGMSALDNVGCHLLAIRAYAVPSTAVAEISCGYQGPAERRVWLEKTGQRVAGIDLLNQAEPIIQRFIAKLEASLETGEFPLDLAFALRVADDMAALR